MKGKHSKERNLVKDKPIEDYINEKISSEALNQYGHG